MPVFEVTARFPDAAGAAAAQHALLTAGLRCHIVSEGTDLGKLETRFMGKIVLFVALWSVFGTAFGAGMGVLIATIFGPDGRQGMVIQAVSWAIFAHLLGGMGAGYLLLADRTRRDLPIAGGSAVLLVVECATIDDANANATVARLRELGATDVKYDVPIGR